MYNSLYETKLRRVKSLTHITDAAGVTSMQFHFTEKQHTLLYESSKKSYLGDFQEGSTIVKVRSVEMASANQSLFKTT